MSRRNFLTAAAITQALGIVAASPNLVVSTDTITSDEHEALLRAVEYMYNPTQSMLGPIVNLAAGSNQTNASTSSRARQEDAIVAVVDQIYADTTAMNNVATINSRMAALGGRQRVVASQRAATDITRAHADVASKDKSRKKKK